QLLGRPTCPPMRSVIMGGCSLATRANRARIGPCLALTCPPIRSAILGGRSLATRAVPMAPLSPVMRTGTITRWHVAVGQHVGVGDRLTLENDTPILMQVEGHEDVYITAILAQEGEVVAPKVCVALAVDMPEELGAALPSADEIRAMETRDEHQF
ncbi:hypothetical protein T492DRAFT_955894, partial [Pavlovales sp. CCMP2436]